MERLNNSAKKGAINLVSHQLHHRERSGSAAELLSGRREMSETTSSTLTGVKNTRDAPGRTVEKVGSGAPAVFLPHSIDFIVKKLTEFMDAYVRTSRWLPASKQ